MNLSIDLIRTDGGTQLRAAGSNATISEYAAELAGGAIFPPVIVFYDGKIYWLADGYHRVEGHKKAGLDEIEADVRQGSQREAILFATSANATHGLRRTSEDKKNAILALLRDPEWSKWSDRQIGDHVRCDHKTVAKYRRELLKPAEILSAAMTPEDEAGEFPTPSEPPSSEQAPPGGGVFASFLAKIPVEALFAEVGRRGYQLSTEVLVAELRSRGWELEEETADD